MNIKDYEYQLKNDIKPRAEKAIADYVAEQALNDADFNNAISNKNLEKAFEIAKSEGCENRIKYFSRIIEEAKPTGRIIIARDAAKALGVHLSPDTLIKMLEYNIKIGNLDAIKEVLRSMTDGYRHERVCSYIEDASLSSSLKEQLLYMNYAIDNEHPKTNSGFQKKGNPGRK